MEPVPRVVVKQLDAGLLEVIDYPEWLANIVPKPKNDRIVRMSVDYRDLDKLVLMIAFHYFTLKSSWIILLDMHYYLYGWFLELQSNLNGFRKSCKDFITPWGTFCYKVMRFGLKNAGAMYQRAIYLIP